MECERHDMRPKGYFRNSSSMTSFMESGSTCDVHNKLQLCISTFKGGYSTLVRMSLGTDQSYGLTINLLNTKRENKSGCDNVNLQKTLLG